MAAVITAEVGQVLPSDNEFRAPGTVPSAQVYDGPMVGRLSQIERSVTQSLSVQS